MKKIFSLYFLNFLLTGNISANNYYVSSLGNDANNGRTTTQAWASISKVNSFTFAAKDSILFRRGDTFYGGIIVNRSQINYGVYGNGAKPVITGFTNVTGWTNIGGNIWESSVITTNNTPNIVTISSTPVPMGRYPDDTYLPITGASGNSQIVSTSLTGSPNFTGAEVVIRKNHWIISRDVIKSQSERTINYTGTTTYNSSIGCGFFVQNSLAACTTQDEWFFNNRTDKLYIYSASSPSNVKISTIDKGIDVAGFNYTDIVNLTIEGMNEAGISIGTKASNSKGCDVINCNIVNSGRDGIFGTNNNNLTIRNCTINNSFNNGIYMENEGGRTKDLKVTDCTIKNSGKYAGMGYPNSTGGLGMTFCGIVNFGERGIIQNNTIDTTGYVPIWFRNDSTLVKYNNINYFCFIKDDGAGIYTHTGYDGNVHFKGRRIVSNIVRNGIGAPLGTLDLKSSAHGIYLDDGSSGVVVDSNTIINTSYGGIYVHNADSIIITNNVIYGCKKMQLLMVHDLASPVSPLRKITMKKNIFFSTSDTSLIVNINSASNDIDSMSFPPYSIDSNIYSQQKDSNAGFLISRTNSFNQTGRRVKETGNLSLIRTTNPNYDVNSTMLASSISSIEYNASSTARKVSFLGLSKKDVYGNVYNNSASIPAWGSLILIDNGIASSEKNGSTIKPRQNNK